jgi:redox-sensitive bicupin YhaK (pirin superfamily)
VTHDEASPDPRGGVSTLAGAESVLLPGHDVPLGRYTTVRRLLPQRPRRMVGAWCFVDHFGPEDITGRTGMQIPPHPHCGLQTVTWLVEGEIVHRDSVGHDQVIRPGQLNLMTSGHGIAHSEMSPADHPPTMHGLQLWVALPDGARDTAPGFEHHAGLPVVELEGARATVVVGAYAGVRSPARVHSPLVALELHVAGPAATPVELDPAFEHGLLALSGSARVGGTELTPGSLLYLPPGETRLEVAGDGPARVFVIGGEPFEEPLVMWWNFVARTHEEVVQAREDWESGDRFGVVRTCDADRLPAPALPTVRLKARDRHGVTVG